MLKFLMYRLLLAAAPFWAANPSQAREVAPTEAPAEVTALDPVPVQPVVIRDVDPALWVVKDADTTIYLFGTVHILKPGMGWFDDGVKAAFDRSDRLVLEMVEPSAAETQMLFGRLAMDKSGKTVRSKMTEADRNIYEAAMAKVGIPAEGLDPFDPWAAAVTLQVVAMTQKGFDVNSGAEKQLTAAAKATNKPIEGVETMEYQLGVFDALSDEAQVKFLIETAKSIDEIDTSMDRLVELWARPDPEALASEMNEGLINPALYTALLTNRNANWAKWISAELAKPGTTFMAVGAGHLSGRTSVPVLLSAYGLTAERVAY
ncbi:MAG: TraB/GumN family protein [Sphingorhabdus sp.]